MDQPPSLNYTPQVSNFIPLIPSNIINDDNIISHSDKSIITKKISQ